MFHFYADESGHAGINYLAADQPFHVAAGLLVRSGAEDAVRALVVEEFKSGEVKGSTLMKTRGGRLRADNLLRAVYRAGAVPFFVMMERWYALAGKLVDVFLDPEHQPLVDWLPTSAVEERKAITETLCECLDPSVMEQFARAYREPTEAGWREVLGAVVTSLKRGGDRRLVLAFEGALACVSEIVRAETYGDEKGKHAQWAALNLPSLMHLLRMVDTFVDGRGPVAVVHDEQFEFAPLFTATFQRVSDRSGRQLPDLLFPDGTRFRAVLRNTTEFTIRNSKHEPLLQAADVLASCVARVARECCDPNAPIEDGFRPLALLTMPPLLYMDDRPHTGGAFARESTIAGLLTVSIQEANRSGSPTRDSP